MKARRFVVFGLLALAAASGALLAQAPQEIGTWVSLGNVGVLTNGAAVTLPDGRTLITGGLTTDGAPTAGVTAFDPVDRSIADAGSLVAPRSGHTATLLPDGRVLVAGGVTESGFISTDLEIFDPATSASTIVSQLPEPRTGHVAAVLLDGTVLIAGGVTTDGTMLRSAVLFDPETLAVSPVAGQLQVARVNASAATLLDGRVLIIGGSDGATDLASADVYDYHSQAFSAAASQMSVPRHGHTATLLPNNGGVLVAGGTSNGAAQNGTELLLPPVFPDPFSYGEGTFTATGSMSVPRANAIAGAMSADGFSFVAGGGSSDAEMYRFATIKTDKDDYAPGEPAAISGSGWQPGEEVTLLFQEDPAVHEDYVLKVTADGSGNFSWNQWSPEPHDLGVRFYLTASGSKSRAQVTFTDATATTTTVSTNPNPSTPGASVTATATVAAGTTAVTQGVVKFYVGGNNCNGNGQQLGTQFGPAGGVALDGSGHASASTTLLTDGVTVRACYGGFGSGSSALQESSGSVVQGVITSIATTTVASSSSNPSTYGGSVTFSAVVSRSTGSGTPTGSVQFKIDNVNFGSPVSLGSPSTTTSATATSGAINSLTTGTHVVDAVYIPTGSFVASADTLDGGQVVNKADAVCTITGFTGNYDAASHGASGSCVGVAIDPTAAGSSLSLGATFTSAPGGTANWSFTGGTNYNNQSGSVAITINKADAVCTISGFTGTYDAAAHGASGSCVGVATDPTAAGSTLSFGATFVNAPGGSANWSFTGGTNYKNQSGSVAITISKADAVCTIHGYTGAYDAIAHGATGSCSGVDNGAAAGGTLDRGASFTNVPGGTAQWSFTGGANYKDQSGSVSITINKADAVCSITGYTGNYDAASHGATGSCSGVDNGAAAGGSLDLGATFTNVPGGTANWSFTGGTNYNNQSGTAAIVINKADAVCTINGYTGTFDANPHGATGSCAGITADPSAAGSSLSLGSSFTNAPGGAAHWTFTGGTNYNDQSGDAAIVINKADAACTINGYTGTYDANPHGATGSCAGIAADPAATGSSLNLGASFTNAPGGSAHWTFTGGTNYNDQSGDAAIVINKAHAACTINGYTGTYDANPHSATGSCAGIAADPAATGSSLNLGASFTNAPGGTAHWAFTGGSNYIDQSGDVAIIINKANAVCTIAGYSGIYDAMGHGASGSCTGVNNGPAVGATLNLGASYTNVPGGIATWNFAGGTNYNDQTGTVTIAISKATAVCNISGYSGIYDGHAHAASGSCAGADNGAAAGSTLDLGTSFTNVPGGSATWTFHGGTNYNDQGGSAIITIAKADPTVTVSGYTGVYDAQPHGASGTATGVLAEALAGLNLGASFSDYPGGTAHWVFTDQTGNYNNASGNVAIVISKANATIVVNGYSGTYDMQPHGASGSATGVGGVNLSGGLNLGSSFTNVPGGTAHWTFAGGINYNDAAGNVAIVINKANATCTVSGYDVIFDNAFHTATGSCTGVSATALSGLNLSGTTHKDAGDYADAWTFVDVTGNYNGATGAVADKIRHWTTDGFYQPVDMSGAQIVWNTVKGGSTVPLKFNLLAGAVKRTNVADVQSFAVAETQCGASTIETAVEFTTTGGTQLRYDGTAGQFIQNWQTPKGAGTCYMVRMTALDGSTIDAWFKMK